MREFRFRAWDKKGFMHDSNDLDVSEDYFVAFDSGVMHLYHVNTIGDYTELKIMQYTGLKDKNGVEIYEGDIFSGDSYEATMFKHWGADVEVSAERYLIKYHDASFKIFDSKGNRLAVLNHHVSSKVEKLEVIGNIYENPELLEVN